MSARMCQNCQVRPCSRGYDYCGKTCADIADAESSMANMSLNPMMCANCGTQPTCPPHGFCSKTCGVAYKARSREWERPSRIGSSDLGSSTSSRGATLSRAPSHPGRYADTFSQKPQPAPKRICGQCRVKPAYQDLDYCSRACHNEANAQTPVLQIASRRDLDQHDNARDAHDEDRYEVDWDGEDDDQGCVSSDRERRARRLDGPSTPTSAARNGDDDDDDDESDGTPSRVKAPKRREDIPVSPRLSRSATGRRGLCLFCEKFEKGSTGEFCSDRCKADARAALRDGGAGGMRRQEKQHRRDMSHNPPSPDGPPCFIKTCQAAVYATGAKYCSNEHRELAVKLKLERACLMCNKRPMLSRSYFCGTACQKAAEANAPMLLPLPESDRLWTEIKKQFEDTWDPFGDQYDSGDDGFGMSSAAAYGLAPSAIGGKPVIHRIYKVINSKAVENQYQAYRNTVEAKGNFAAQGKSPGNEQRRWVGVSRACTIGDTWQNLTMCVIRGCGVCATLRSSYTLTPISTPVTTPSNPFAMFPASTGSGLYVPPRSSTYNVPSLYSLSSGLPSHGRLSTGTLPRISVFRKSSTANITTSGSYKALFLNRIVAGKVSVPQALDWKSGPAKGGSTQQGGHDSVASDAQHNTLSVFRADAICPSWLVLYS